MTNDETKLYSVKYLRKILKREKLPSSYKTVLRYEEDGVIPKSSNTLADSWKSKMRLYSMADINKIVEAVRKHKKDKKKGVKKNASGK